jgi:hypothetical protein
VRAENEAKVAEASGIKKVQKKTLDMKALAEKMKLQEM